ncbi:Putative AC transposase [Linum grandiflorum]
MGIRIELPSQLICGQQQIKKEVTYMTITGHYIDNHSTLRGHLLSFSYVPTPHTSKKLATVLHNCLMIWNVDYKLSIITLDNYSTNDALIDKIKRKLVLSELLMNIPCFKGDVLLTYFI